MGVGKEHSSFGVEEVVTQDDVNLVGGCPIDAETVEDAQVFHVGIGKCRERKGIVQQGFRDAEYVICLGVMVSVYSV